MSERKCDCMYLFPTELTGRNFDVCGLFGNRCYYRSLGVDCAIYTEHNEYSRKALAEAIEIKRKEREAKGGAK